MPTDKSQEPKLFRVTIKLDKPTPTNAFHNLPYAEALQMAERYKSLALEAHVIRQHRRHPEDQAADRCHLCLRSEKRFRTTQRKRERLWAEWQAEKAKADEAHAVHVSGRTPAPTRDGG